MVFPVRTRSWIMVEGQTRAVQVVANSHRKRATGNRGKVLTASSQKVWLTSLAEGRSLDRPVVCVGQDIWHQVHSDVVSILGKQQVAETQINELPFSGRIWVHETWGTVPRQGHDHWGPSMWNWNHNMEFSPKKQLYKVMTESAKNCWPRNP